MGLKLISKKDFYKLLNTSFYRKTKKNVRSRLKIEIIKKDDKRILKQQSELTFKGIQKSFKNFDSYIFKQNEVPMNKPIYLGFAVLELCSSLIFETYYDLE